MTLKLNKYPSVLAGTLNGRMGGSLWAGLVPKQSHTKPEVLPGSRQIAREDVCDSTG